MNAIKLLRNLVLIGIFLFAGFNMPEVTANALPDDRPWIKDFQECMYVKEANWTVRFCRWTHSTQNPKESDIREVIAIMQKEFGDDTPFYTTVMIEPANTVLNSKYRGVYLPATGNIIVAYPYDDDLAQMYYTIAHEMLHAVWDVQGVPMAEHHPLIYCEDPLLPVSDFLDKYVDPTQIPRIVDRVWQHESMKWKFCGEGFPYEPDSEEETTTKFPTPNMSTMPQPSGV